MKERFVCQSHQKRTDESRCTAAVWLLYNVQVYTVDETSLFSEVSSPSTFIRNESPYTNFISGESSKPSFSSYLQDKMSLLSGEFHISAQNAPNNNTTTSTTIVTKSHNIIAIVTSTSTFSSPQFTSPQARLPPPARPRHSATTTLRFGRIASIICCTSGHINKCLDVRPHLLSRCSGTLTPTLSGWREERLESPHRSLSIITDSPPSSPRPLLSPALALLLSYKLAGHLALETSGPFLTFNTDAMRTFAHFPRSHPLSATPTRLSATFSSSLGVPLPARGKLQHSGIFLSLSILDQKSQSFSYLCVKQSVPSLSKAARSDPPAYSTAVRMARNVLELARAREERHSMLDR
ncbi:unnamed protein product [Protopolystoma xenopodis]|uniref:Uncharacterized protein n=1 Tax=Protopolystoma xenopodis TaxID=117903 RepID=A0A448WDI8_9PLAT|nr:unnamed protein product [Protopolystoma xenopodis]